MPYKNCLICNEKFYTKPNWIKLGWGKYCSRKCSSINQLKGKPMACFMCNKETYKSPKQLVRSKSGKFFCSKSCQTLWRNTVLYVGRNNKHWKTGESTYRAQMTKNKEMICHMCGLTDKRVLVVHHLDRHRSNNELENLVWLCCNCHYLVHHDQELLEKLNMVAGAK